MYTISTNNAIEKTLTEQVTEALLSQDAYEDNPVSEQQLADLFGVSRTPIRDSLAELERSGVVERRQKKGVYLRRNSLTEVTEYFDVRSVLEGFAGRMAATKITQGQLDHLAQCAENYSQARDAADQPLWLVADRAFHKTILNVADNQLLLRIFDQFWIMQQTFLRHFLSRTATFDPNPYSHAMILEALTQHDADETERILKSHIQTSKQFLIEQALGTKLNHFENTSSR